MKDHISAVRPRTLPKPAGFSYAYEVKRAFGLAARERGRQAIEISCAPGDSQWCTDDFVQACDDHDGGMSTNPDGSATCSMPQHE